MKPSLQVIGVVMARKGSKGVPGKNLAKVGKRSLLVQAIRTAKRAKTLTRVILSTDSKEMARIGRQAGAEVPFIRPAHLARDTAHTPDVIEHAVDFLEKRDGRPVDIIVTLQPTSPFRRAEHIDAAVRLLLKQKQLDSVISVNKTEFPPYWMFQNRRHRLSPLFDDGTDYSLKERQQLPEVFQPNGAVYVTRRALLKKRGLIFSAFSKGATGFIVMDSLSSTDIDHPIDLVTARTLIKQHPELIEN